jgi:hypothetical protein
MKDGPIVESRAVWVEIPHEDDFTDDDDFEFARVKAHEASDDQIEEEREALFQLMKKSRRKRCKVAAWQVAWC